MTTYNRLLRLCLLLCIASLSTGCSTLSSLDNPSKHHSADPFESLNRGIYSFNTVADNVVLRPTAKAYKSVVPRPARIGVGNFFANLGEPLNLVNNLLQGKGDAALTSGYRFIVNSTVGVLGVFDIAKLQSIERRHEDFGQTLAAWGVRPGPYLLLPFVGPSNLRDAIGGGISNAAYYPIDAITSNGSAITGLTIANIVNQRTLFLSSDGVFQQQQDPYTFSKSLFEYNRVRAIYDGNPPKSQIDNDIDDF